MPRTTNLFPLLILFSICGFSPEPAHAFANESHAEPTAGELVQTQLLIQASALRDICESQHDEIRLELLQALDERAPQIASEASKYFENETWKVVSLGSKFFARERKAKPTPNDEWRLFEESWTYWIAQYQKIKHQPIGKDWVELTAAAKGLLADDVDRTANPFSRSWYRLRRRDEPHLVTLAQAIEACRADSGCPKPSLTEETADLVIRVPILLEGYIKIAQSAKAEDRRKAIDELVSHVASLSEKFRMRANPAAKRVSPTQIRVPMDGSAFADALTQISGYIESLWRSDSLEVKIDWVKKAAAPDVFQIFAEPGIGARAYVNFGKRSMHLYSYVRSRTLAHEFGHVLGFEDQYYTYWFPESCGYETSVNRANLMSESGTGFVTAEHWQRLEKTYPLNRKRTGHRSG